MSHDQKPGRLRVVSNAASAPQRRRGDAASDAQQDVAGPATAPVATSSRKPALLLAMLFIVGCAAGGAALPFTGLIGS